MNLSETCQAGAYNTTDLQQLVTRLVGQEAATRFGSGYGLTGDMSITLASTVITPTSQQIATISVNAVSQWVYQVGKSQQQQISHQIAGKSKHDALFMLSHLDGIRGASVNLVGGYNDLLPQNTDCGDVSVCLTLFEHGFVFRSAAHQHISTLTYGKKDSLRVY